jgi:hypothetical protein
MVRRLIISTALLLHGGRQAGAGETEPATPDWNKDLAAERLDERIQAWFAFAGADRGTGKDKISCLSCHSVVPYFLARPALRRLAGITSATPHESKLIEQTQRRVRHWKELDSDRYRLSYDFSEEKKKQSWGTEAVLNALVLAFDDHYRGGSETSETTKAAFANLWQTQITDGEAAGSWQWLDFGLEPWETKKANYFGAALAALAVGTAPRYFVAAADEEVDRKVALLRGYLRKNLAAQSLNNRIWALWASARLNDVLSGQEKASIVDALWQKQQEGGGWSLSSLGTALPTNGFIPDKKSDGYATGLVLHVLQTAGHTKDDVRIAKGLSWLRTHQEKNGQWPARSVNRERDPASHVGKFMSDAATAFAVLALSH